ncbi:hypothetical protein [Actinoalloteichus fjordicus]|nr:hypothetical protein [Actinoalloteichus fjordicus]
MRTAYDDAEIAEAARRIGAKLRHRDQDDEPGRATAQSASY